MLTKTETYIQRYTLSSILHVKTSFQPLTHADIIVVSVNLHNPTTHHNDEDFLTSLKKKWINQL